MVEGKTRISSKKSRFCLFGGTAAEAGAGAETVAAHLAQRRRHRNALTFRFWLRPCAVSVFRKLLCKDLPATDEKTKKKIISYSVFTEATVSDLAKSNLNPSFKCCFSQTFGGIASDFFFADAAKGEKRKHGQTVCVWRKV